MSVHTGDALFAVALPPSDQRHRKSSASLPLMPKASVRKKAERVRSARVIQTSTLTSASSASAQSRRYSAGVLCCGAKRVSALSEHLRLPLSFMPSRLSCAISNCSGFICLRLGKACCGSSAKFFTQPVAERHARPCLPISDQEHGLKLELPRKLPTLRDAPPALVTPNFVSSEPGAGQINVAYWPILLKTSAVAAQMIWRFSLAIVRTDAHDGTSASRTGRVVL